MSLGSDTAANVLIHSNFATALRKVAARAYGTDTVMGEDITLRRGASTLAVQSVRIGATTRGLAREAGGKGGGASQAPILVIGGPSFDVQLGDRFNDANEILYEVTFVRPNRQVHTVAEAVMVQ
jgi:hypothetical protein